MHRIRAVASMPSSSPATWHLLSCSSYTFSQNHHLPGFGFLVCYASKQLALELHQERIQVVHSNRVTWKPEDTPAIDLGLEWFFLGFQFTCSAQFSPVSIIFKSELFGWFVLIFICILMQTHVYILFHFIYYICLYLFSFQILFKKGNLWEWQIVGT